MSKDKNTKRKPGRPKLPKGHAKGKIVLVRLSESETKLFTKAADKSPHKTLSAWIRATLQNAAESELG
jgi:hypothetical protein